LDIFSLSPLQWEKQTNTDLFREKFVKHKYVSPFGSYSYIGWNLQRPVFKDKRVRQALAHLVDRSTINEKLNFGLYYPITGPFFPFGENYDPSLKPYSYDLEEAKRLLTEAGWVDRNGDGIREKNGMPFHFTFIFPSGIQFYERLTPILRQEFLKAGIVMELRRLEGNTMFQMIHEHDFDAYIAAWGRGAGGEDLYQIWHSSQIAGGSNYVSYNNPAVDRLLEEGRKEFDSVKRSKIFKQVHAQLHEDQPYLFMFAAPSLLARDKRFQNVTIYPAGPDFREWTVD
ncbi:MAG: ABC transporter substrate-binding protein, partial [Deltaproteobacteria bacterium]|nr:ABC transporter substrate-binding protein [Deltaproteobacteria bacterium]